MVGRKVQDEIALHNGKPCDCFCRFKSVASKDMYEPTTEVKCACVEKGGVTISSPNETKPEGQISKPFDPNRYRYKYPRKSRYRVADYGLMLALDAGDKESFNESEPTSWKDVSKGGASQIEANIQGAVSLDSELGGGSLRFGSNGGGDRAVVSGMDISPNRFRDITIEVWIRLENADSSIRGWAVGNDDGNSTGGRSLIANDPRFSPEGMEGGASAISANGAYVSTLGVTPTQEWMQLVGVWQHGHTSYLYRNGNRDVASSETNNKIGIPDLVIGGHPTESDMNIDGEIALVRVYSRALSVKEIKSNFCFSAPRFDMHCPSDWGSMNA